MQSDKKQLHYKPKGILFAGLAGGSGKSVITVGVTAALARMGKHVAPFKKGPDYIDAGWLHLAAGTLCYNLDPYLMSPEIIQQSCFEHSKNSQLIIVEGNRGLFDGVNISGSYSSAELAAILNIPVLLVIDCTKMTRTASALVMGCIAMGKDISIKGVILNRIGSARHERVIRQSIEHYTDVSVLGAMPRLSYDIFPQRHIGITPCQEYEESSSALDDLANHIAKHIDLHTVEEIAEPAKSPTKDTSLYAQWKPSGQKPLKVGVLKDAAFQFYYPENLKALECCGATIIEIDALSEKTLPNIDGLYIGGGFPETNVQALSKNETFKSSLKRMIDNGLPVYAECGGLIYLGKDIKVNDETFPLTGIFPVSFQMQKKPQAHGYTILTATKNNPFYPKGTKITGHEFRYSKVSKLSQDSDCLALTMERGTGFSEGKDGLVYKNVLALYTHIHALSTPEWAPAFISKVREVSGKN